MKIKVTRTKMPHDEFQRQIDEKIRRQFMGPEMSKDERFWLALFTLIVVIIPGLFALMWFLVNAFRGYGVILSIVIVIITIYQWGRLIEGKNTKNGNS